MTKNLIIGTLFATVSNLLLLAAVARTLPVTHLDLYLQVFGFYSLSIGIASGFINYTALPEMRSGASVEVTFFNYFQIFIILILMNLIFALISLKFMQAILGATLASIMVARTFLVSSILARKEMYLFGNVTVGVTQTFLAGIVLLIQPSNWYVALILFEFLAILCTFILFIRLDLKVSRIDKTKALPLRSKIRRSFPNFTMFFAFSGFSLIDSIYAGAMPDGLYANINLVHRFGIAFVTIFLNSLAVKFIFHSLDQHKEFETIRSEFRQFSLALLLTFIFLFVCVYALESNVTEIFSKLFSFSWERAQQLTKVFLWYIPGLALMSASTVLYRIIAAFRISPHFAITSGILWPTTYLIGIEIMHLPQTEKFPLSFFFAWLVSFIILHLGFSKGRSNI